MTDTSVLSSQPRNMPWYALIWIWVIIGFDALGATAFLFFNHIVVDKAEPHVSSSQALLYVLDDVVTIFLAVGILRWKKWGVWGLFSTSVLVFVGSYAYSRSTPSAWGVLQIVVLILVLFVGGRRSVWAQFPKS